MQRSSHNPGAMERSSDAPPQQKAQQLQSSSVRSLQSKLKWAMSNCKRLVEGVERGMSSMQRRFKGIEQLLFEGN